MALIVFTISDGDGSDEAQFSWISEPSLPFIEDLDFDIEKCSPAQVLAACIFAAVAEDFDIPNGNRLSP